MVDSKFECHPNYSHTGETYVLTEKVENNLSEKKFSNVQIRPVGRRKKKERKLRNSLTL